MMPTRKRWSGYFETLKQKLNALEKYLNYSFLMIHNRKDEQIVPTVQIQPHPKRRT